MFLHDLAAIEFVFDVGEYSAFYVASTVADVEA